MALVLGRVQASGAPGPVGKPACEDNAVICTEVADSIGYAGAYTGHDEPSLLFYSDQTRAERNGWDLQFPAPSGLLVRDGDV
jgi:hypothetical protein